MELTKKEAAVYIERMAKYASTFPVWDYDNHAPHISFDNLCLGSNVRPEILWHIAKSHFKDLFDSGVQFAEFEISGMVWDRFYNIGTDVESSKYLQAVRDGTQKP